MATNLTNFVGEKINEQPTDPNFTETRLGVSVDPDTGKIYKVTIQQWVDILTGLGISYAGAADTTTDPGVPTNAVYYSATSVGTYTNFKDSDGNSIVLGDTELMAFLSFNGTAWTKQVIDISGNLVLKGDLINSVSDSSTDKALAASVAGLLNDAITRATKYGTWTDETGTTSDVWIGTLDGTQNTSSYTYSSSDFIAVTPGETIKFTGTCLGCTLVDPPSTNPVGLVGFSTNAASGFLSTHDDDDLPIGCLWSNDRYKLAGGAVASKDTPVNFTQKEIVIPDGCYYVRGTSAVYATGSIALKIEREIYDDSSETVKDKVSGAITKDDIVNNITSVDDDKALAASQGTVLKSLIDSATKYGTKTDVTGATTDVWVRTTDGVSGTSANTYQATDFIPVIPGDSIVFSGVCLGAQLADTLPSNPTAGIAGYASNTEGSFLSVPDEDGKPIGAIWDLDRWILEGNSFPTGTGAKLFQNIELIIPDGCYYIRGCSAYFFGDAPVLVQKVTYSDNSETVKDRLENINPDAEGYNDRIAQLVKAYSAGTADSHNPDTDRFTFIHFSDIHFDSLNSGDNMDELLAFMQRDLIKDDVDALIFTGDICNGYYGRTKTTTTAEIGEFMTKILTSPKTALSILGNHDDNVNFVSGNNPTTTYAQAIKKSEQYTTVIEPLIDKWGTITGVEDKGYWYADFATWKIRVIGLDCYDIPIIDAGDGTIKYKGGYVHYYSQGQLDWLYNTLHATDSSYGVILLNHAPISSNYPYGNFTQGYDLIPSVINAWQNGTSYSHDYTDAVNSEMGTSKVFDFSADGEKEFICCLSGHLHNTVIDNMEGFTDQKMIVVPCTYTGSAWVVSPASVGSSISAVVRGDGYELKNAFFNISIDRARKKIVVIPYGAFRDVDGKIKDQITVIDY